MNSQKNKYYFFILMCSCSYIFNIYKYVYIYIILYTIVYYYVQNVNIFIKYFGESISEAKRKKKIFVKRSGIEIKWDHSVFVTPPSYSILVSLYLNILKLHIT